MSTLALPKNSTNVRSNIDWALRLKVLGLRLRALWPTPGAVRDAVRWFCTPYPGTRARALRADPGGARQQVIQAGTDRWMSYVYGDPTRQPYVLCAHGWSSFGQRFQRWVAPLQDAGYALVCFDHLAHGRSSGDAVTLPGFAEGVLAVGLHYGAPALAIGHSLGGAAVALAQARGLNASRLLLLAPAAEGESALQRFVSHLGLSQTLPQRMQALLEQQTGIPMRDCRAEAATPHIRVPTLVIHDLADADVAWGEGERYALQIPGARMLTVSGLGHHRVVDAPEVLEAGLGFLAGAHPGEHLQAARALSRGL